MELKKRDFSVLLTHFLFSGVDPALLKKELCGDRVWVGRFSDGELIHSPRMPEPVAGIILSGKAEVTTPDPGKKSLMRFLHAGDLFGIANLFTKEPFVSVVRASGPCRCVAFRESAMRALLDESPEFRENYIGFLSGRIRYLNRKIGYLTAGSTERRLALYLLSLGDGTVQLKESIASLSDLLDIGRASLYRAFDRFCDDGYLIKDGKYLTVTDREALLAAYQ